MNSKEVLGVKCKRDVLRLLQAEVLQQEHFFC